MTFPFTENPEDFSEMMKIPKGMPFLAISMKQKVVVKVDEKGTEATAVTRARLRALSYKPSPPNRVLLLITPFCS